MVEGEELGILGSDGGAYQSGSNSLIFSISPREGSSWRNQASWIALKRKSQLRGLAGNTPVRKSFCGEERAPIQSMIPPLSNILRYCQSTQRVLSPELGVQDPGETRQIWVPPSGRLVRNEVSSTGHKAQEPCGGELLKLKKSGRVPWRRLLSAKMIPHMPQGLELGRPSRTT